MQWIKASDRKPDFISSKKKYIIRYTLIPEEYFIWDWYMIDERLNAEYEFEYLDESPDLPATDDQFLKEPVTFLLSNALRHLSQDQQRQLCNALLERLPVVTDETLQREAEELYPDAPEEKLLERYTGYLVGLQRTAYIACAKSFIQRIRALEEEIERRVDKDGVKKLFEAYCRYKNNEGEMEFNEWLDAPVLKGIYFPE